MGLFDGKIIEMGNTLAQNIDMRADLIRKDIEDGKHREDPGQSLAMKISVFVLNAVASAIRESVNKE